MHKEAREELVVRFIVLDLAEHFGVKRLAAISSPFSLAC
jgi:hypothetical protein